MNSSTAYLFSLYTRELNFGQTISDKIEVLLGMHYGTTWELEEPQGNHVRNTLGTRKTQKKRLYPKKEKSMPIMSVCWDFPLAE
jgi:hypothetical protein